MLYTETGHINPSMCICTCVCVHGHVCVCVSAIHVHVYCMYMYVHVCVHVHITYVHIILIAEFISESGFLSRGHSDKFQMQIQRWQINPKNPEGG